MAQKDITSMELKLFDSKGGLVFRWNRAPNNIFKGLKTLKKKGIKIDL